MLLLYALRTVCVLMCACVLGLAAGSHVSELCIAGSTIVCACVLGSTTIA